MAVGESVKMYSRSTQETLFAEFLVETTKGLAEILENERPYLFDFLLRMTRQYTRAIETIDEVFNEILARSSEYKSLERLRIDLFSACREANRDIWNVDTQKLENQTLANNLVRSSTGPEQAEIIRQYQEIDRFISTLAPRARECTLLTLRHGFSQADAAAIMGMDREIVEDTVRRTQQNMRALKVPTGVSLLEAIQILDAHELPENRTIYMTDLQEVIGGIRKDIPGRIGQAIKIAFLLVALGGLIYVYLFMPELFSSVATWGMKKFFGFFR